MSREVLRRRILENLRNTTPRTEKTAQTEQKKARSVSFYM